MAQMKVTDGHTTRKFCLQPGEDSFQQLKQRLAAFFPKSVKEDQEMQLLYTDSDGDLITVTTDSEFQEALKQLPPQTVWKINIHSLHDKARHVSSVNPAPPRSRYADALRRPRQVVRPSQRNPWLPLFPYGHTHPLMWDFPSWSDELDDFISYSSLLHDAIKKSHEEQSSQRNAPASSAPASSAQQGNTETAGNKPQSSKGDGAKGSDSLTEVDESVLSSIPGVKVHKFGSWEPRHYEGEHGRGTVIGPVGYYASWGHKGDKEEDKTTTQEGGDKKGEEKKNEEPVAGSEA